MIIFSRKIGRRIFLAGLLGLAGGSVIYWARFTAVERIVGFLLHRAGAEDVVFHVSEASPWGFALEEVGFKVKTNGFSARRVAVARPHWWTPSLGVIRVEQASWPLTIDGSDVDARAWPTYKNSGTVRFPASVPAEEVFIDGQLILRAAEVPEQALSVKLEARWAAGNTWTGKFQMDGPGLGVKGVFRHNLANDQFDFSLPDIALDLKNWQSFVQRLVLFPAGPWVMAGKFSGHAEGRWAGRTFTSTGTIHLRDGRVREEAKDITAEGIEADLEFTDIDQLLTKPGAVRIRELRIGTFPLRALSAEIAMAGSDRFTVSGLSFQAFGGRASAAPFNYFPSLRELEAVLRVDDLRIEEVLAVTDGLPAKATGRVNGGFPIRVDDSGIRLGTGWLGLPAGAGAELQLQSKGLLTGGLSERGPGYAVLQKIESGLLKLALSELRLDIRPPDAPPGRSARLRISGSAVDSGVRVPVVIELFVSGPLEGLVNLGLDSRARSR